MELAHFFAMHSAAQTSQLAIHIVESSTNADTLPADANVLKLRKKSREPMSSWYLRVLSEIQARNKNINNATFVGICSEANPGTWRHRILLALASELPSGSRIEVKDVLESKEVSAMAKRRGVRLRWSIRS